MDAADLIKKYLNKVLHVFIIIIALLFAQHIYKNQLKYIGSLKEKKSDEEKKNVVLENIAQMEKKYKPLKSAINNKDVSLAINTIGSIAKRYAIKIIAIRPANEQDYPMYTKYPFDLSVKADSYHALGKFISDLESHPDIYLLDSITIKSVSTGAKGHVSNIVVDLKLSTILLKN